MVLTLRLRYFFKKSTLTFSLLVWEYKFSFALSILLDLGGFFVEQKREILHRFPLLVDTWLGWLPNSEAFFEGRLEKELKIC